jgi:Ni/Co efflux regulator RcnB
MKSLLLVALSAATMAATMALAIDDASAEARRSGVNRAGVQAGGVNRGAVNRAGVNRAGIDRVGVNRVGIDRVGVDRAGVAYRPGLVGANRVGWNDNWNNLNRPGWGVAGAGLAFGAAAASAGYGYGYGSYDSRSYPTRAEYARSYRYGYYYGPVCNPWIDRLCQ